MSRRGFSMVALWLAVACSPPSTTREEGKVAPRAVEPTPQSATCNQSTDTGVWARFAGKPCTWELREEGEGGLALHDLGVEASAPAVAEVPEPCRQSSCVYEGVLTEAGPAVLVVVRSSQSGMPSTVQLGFVAGERLVFVDLWEGAGDPVETDFTRVGPAHALAPFVCGDKLALFAVERLDAGRGVEAPESLRAREGLLDPQAPEAPAVPVARELCELLPLPLP